MRTKSLMTAIATAAVLAGSLALPVTASAHGAGKIKGKYFVPGREVVYVKPAYRPRYRVIYEPYYVPIRRPRYAPVIVYDDFPRWRYGGGNEIRIIYRGSWD